MRFNPLSRPNLPLTVSIMVTFIVVAIAEASILRETGGVFMYPLDDPFIHMQIAKNLAFHGNWGINPNEFAAASSSLLYTLLLTLCFKLFSANTLIPFLINCAAAILLLRSIHKWLQKQDIPGAARMVILLLIVFLTPLPSLVESGMEHVLQSLFFFLFVTSFSEWLNRVKNNGSQRDPALPWAVLLYGILVTSIRFEGLFVIAVACLILLYYRNFKAAFGLGFVSALPILIFGVYSVAKGSFFLPNSVLIKTDQVPFSLEGLVSFVNNILIYKYTTVKSLAKVPGVPPPGISLLAAQRILLILPLLYFFFIDQLKKKYDYRYALILLAGTTLLHLALAATGWFYRYEAYLVLSAMTFTAVIVYKFGRHLMREKTWYAYFFGALLVFGLFFPFLLRSAAAYSNMKQACINIYQQQYQMARLLKKYYPSDTVAANDIGAISFYSNAVIVDLWGLGNIDVARSKKERTWTPAFLDSLVRKSGVKLAIVYDEWYDPALLQRWVKIASWRIKDNVICGGDTVSFYAMDEKNAEDIKKNLTDFQPSLPSGIGVIYK